MTRDMAIPNYFPLQEDDCEDNDHRPTDLPTVMFLCGPIEMETSG